MVGNFQARAVSSEELRIPGPRGRQGVGAVNARVIEPLYVPELYTRHFDGGENTLMVPAGKDGRAEKYEFLRRIDDPKTSFFASVLLNKETGHAIILYKGMDKPFVNEGGGTMGFATDAKVAFQAALGGMNSQTKDAEKAFVETRNDPRVKSLELVGYSIGSLHMNYMAAKYGAVGTNIADMGISTSLLTSVFNRESRVGMRPGYTLPEISKAMQERVTTLTMRADFLPRSFAASGPRGRETVLDKDSLALGGALHIPYFYMKEAQEMLKNQPGNAPGSAPASETPEGPSTSPLPPPRPPSPGS